MGNIAKCPYCGSTEFLPQGEEASEPVELVCAECGGCASRKLLLQRAGEDRENGRFSLQHEKDLIALCEAAYLALRRTTPRSAGSIGAEPERLDTAAIALSVHVPIYTMDQRGALRRVGQDELLAGRFRGGGRRLAFDDERAPVTPLVVIKDEALKAIDGLAAVNIARAVNAGEWSSLDREDGA